MSPPEPAGDAPSGPVGKVGPRILDPDGPLDRGRMKGSRGQDSDWW